MLQLFVSSYLISSALALSNVGSPTGEANLAPTPAPAPITSVAADKPGPWRLEQALGLPDWFSLSVEQRTRYEAYDQNFRIGPTPRNELFALRTLVAGTVRNENFRFTAELMDSRQYSAPPTAILGTGTVNAVELLQAHVGYEFQDAFKPGANLDVLLGRHTMNVGSRRLIARNRFRNTINGFNGANAVWQSGEGEQIRAFFVLPVWRRPRDQASLQNNDIQIDQERDQTYFYGVHAQSSNLGGSLNGEAYFYVLDEDDETGVRTRNRNLYTLGGRLFEKPKPREFHFEWESALQLGESRATPLDTDVTDLDHRAQFHHLSVGYQFDSDWKPRLEALFDYASGDSDTTDGENNRFETLFGARRFEFGPTGIWGPFARSNLMTPGWRIFMDPHEKLNVMLAHRFHYLASERDLWTTSGLFDPNGDSGRFIGQLAEVRFRVNALPGNIRLEFGVAHLFAGGFIENAPNNTGQGDSTYGYFTTTFNF